MNYKQEIERGLEYFKKHPNEMVSLYEQMYRDTICLTCPGNLEYAYKKMYKDREREIPTIQMKRGKLIDTTMIEDDRLPKGHFTLKNITDEIALVLIELGYSDCFIL